MISAEIASLRDDVESLELLVYLFEDTEDPRLPRYRQKLKKTRAKLAAAEAEARR
jgi:hypothetical protein